MNIFKRAISILEHVTNILAYIAGIMIVVLMLLTIFEVIMRYGLKSPTGWSIEICEYLLLYITFLSAGWLLKNDGHVRVDIVLSILEKKTQKKIALITNAIGGVTCFMLLLYGALSTWDYYERSTMVIQQLNTPKWILLLAIPIGGLMLTFQFIIQFIKNLTEIYSES
jgi:C4-dicarboxylate transporter DctQ subunit